MPVRDGTANEGHAIGRDVPVHDDTNSPPSSVKPGPAMASRTAAQRLTSGMQPSLRTRLLHLPVQVFTVTMASGISSLLLYQFPYPQSTATYPQSSNWSYWPSAVVFGFHTLLILAFAVLSMLRFILWLRPTTKPRHWSISGLSPATGEECFLGALVVVSLTLSVLSPLQHLSLPLRSSQWRPRLCKS
jgi:hypothetical protein